MKICHLAGYCKKNNCNFLPKNEESFSVCVLNLQPWNWGWFLIFVVFWGDIGGNTISALCMIDRSGVRRLVLSSSSVVLLLHLVLLWYFFLLKFCFHRGIGQQCSKSRCITTEGCIMYAHDLGSILLPWYGSLSHRVRFYFLCHCSVLVIPK